MLPTLTFPRWIGSTFVILSYCSGVILMPTNTEFFVTVQWHRVNTA